MKSLKNFGGKAVKVIKKAGKKVVKAAKKVGKAAKKVAKKAGAFIKSNQKVLKKVGKYALIGGALAGAGYVAYKLTQGKADEINRTPYTITRIENGTSDSEFVVSYDSDQSFNTNDKFTVSDTDCNPALPNSLTCKSLGPRQVILTGTKTKLKTPCTKGTLRVLTTAGAQVGGFVKDTVGTVLNTGVDIVKDAGDKVGKGIFEMIASMLGVDTDTLKQIGYGLLFLVCLGLAYKVYSTFS